MRESSPTGLSQRLRSSAMQPNSKFTLPLRAICALLLFVGANAPGHAQQAPAYIENINGLKTILRALAIAQSRPAGAPPVRVIQYGDSHTKADIATGFLRRFFQEDFGAPSKEGNGGVQFEIRGDNGLQAEWLLGLSNEAFARSLGARQPELIIIAYGTNEVTDRRWSFESYKLLYKRIIKRFRAASPTSSILVVGLPDRALQQEDGRWASPGKIGTLLDAQRTAALESGVTFWNTLRAMGGVGSMNVWVSNRLGQPDHAHLTSTGYARLSIMLYSDFVLAFNEFWSGHAGRIRQTVE